uniref:Uncharacterized protein n=1 Tax=Arundo donax TaxID=35708 RepID=A0A0A8YAI7_ARUDO
MEEARVYTHVSRILSLVWPSEGKSIAYRRYNSIYIRIADRP